MKKWIILALASSTASLVFAMPLLSLPVLFTEISDDLGLTIFQIGVIWGTGSFAGFLTSLPFGAIGDRFGPRITLTVGCILVGLFGILRGFAFDYYSLMITMLLHGMLTPIIPPNAHKTAGAWFSERRGMAAGFISAGFALGLMLGSALSATVFSPWLGGWQNVMIFFGIIAIVMGGLWFIIYPATDPVVRKTGPKIPYLEALRTVAQSRQLWLIGVGTLCFWGSYRGFSGYLPVYLKEIGWNLVVADQTLTVFYVVSLIGVMPLSLLSDRFKMRRELGALCIVMLGTGALSLTFVEGLLLWIVLIISGFFFDAFMAIHQAMAQEVDGIGLAFAGTALGFITTVREFGGFVAPPAGNALAHYGLATPFLLWGAIGIAGAFILLLLPTQRGVARKS